MVAMTDNGNGVVDLQRLVDRAVDTFVKHNRPMGRVQIANLQAFIAQIESQYKVCKQTVGDIDELDVVEAQLSLLKATLQRYSAKAEKIVNVESSSDEEDFAPSPARSPVPSSPIGESRFASELKHRPKYRPS